MNLVIANGIPPEANELARLFQQTTWANHRSLEGIEKLIGNLDVFVTARSDGKLIGFARAISDGTFRALVDDVVVDEPCRGRGVGRMMVKTLREELESVEMVFLNTRAPLKGFYEQFGFEEFDGCTMRAQTWQRGNQNSTGN